MAHPVPGEGFIVPRMVCGCSILIVWRDGSSGREWCACPPPCGNDCLGSANVSQTARQLPLFPESSPWYVPGVPLNPAGALGQNVDMRQ